MNTFSIIAIPFFILSVAFFTLGTRKKDRTCLTLSGIFIASTIVNTILGISV